MESRMHRKTQVRFGEEDTPYLQRSTVPTLRLSGHVTTRVLVKSLLTPINSIERMTLGNDKRFSGELPGAYRRSQTGIWRYSSR
jgi:hypothetical protein